MKLVYQAEPRLVSLGQVECPAIVSLRGNYYLVTDGGTCPSERSLVLLVTGRHHSFSRGEMVTVHPNAEVHIK